MAKRASKSAAQAANAQAAAAAGDDDDAGEDAAWEAARAQAGKGGKTAARASASTEEHEAGDDLDDDEAELEDRSGGATAGAGAGGDGAGYDASEGSGETSRVLIERLRERGFEVDEFESDDEILEALEEEVREARQVRERFQQLEPQITEYTSAAAEFRAWQAEKAKQTQGAADEKTTAAKPATPAKPKWDPPAVSEETVELVNRGLLKVDPNTGLYAEDKFPVQAREANKRLVWNRRHSERLLEDPLGLLREAGLDDVLSERDAKIAALEKQIGELKAGYQSDRSTDRIEQFFEEHAQEFFVQGDSQKLTERGEAYRQAYQDAESEYGITDPGKRHDFALKLAYAQHPASGKAGNGKGGASGNGTGAAGANGTGANGAGANGKTLRETRKEKQRLFLGRGAKRHGQVQRTSSRHVSTARSASREAAMDDMDENGLWDWARQEAETELV